MPLSCGFMCPFHRFAVPLPRHTGKAWGNFLECPRDVEAARDTLALALEAREVQSVADGAVHGSVAVSEFEERGAALEASARQVIALIGCCALAVELILPRESCVEFAVHVILHGKACAEADTARSGCAEVIRLAGRKGCARARLMRVEILGIGIDLVAIDEFALLSDPNVTGEVAARQIVAGALRADDAAVIALCTTNAQTALKIGAALALRLCHDTDAEVASLAAAVRAVVEVGVVVAPTVLDERTEGERSVQKFVAACIADVEIPALRINVGAGLEAHASEALRRKQLIAAEGGEWSGGSSRVLLAAGIRGVHKIRDLGRRRLGCGDADIGEEIGAACEERNRRRLCFDERFRLVLHLDIRDVCKELVFRARRCRTTRIQCVLIVEGNTLRRLISRTREVVYRHNVLSVGQSDEADVIAHADRRVSAVELHGDRAAADVLVLRLRRGQHGLRKIGARGEIEVEVLEILEIPDLCPHVIDVQCIAVLDRCRYTRRKFSAIDAARNLGAAQRDSVVLGTLAIAADDIAANMDRGEADTVILCIVTCRPAAINRARDRAARHGDIVAVRLCLALALGTVDVAGQRTAREDNPVAAHCSRSAAGSTAARAAAARTAAARTARRARVRCVCTVDIADIECICTVNRELIALQASGGARGDTRCGVVVNAVCVYARNTELVVLHIVIHRGDAREHPAVCHRCVGAVIAAVAVAQTVEGQQEVGALRLIVLRMQVDFIVRIRVLGRTILVLRIVCKCHLSVALDELYGMRARPCRVQVEFADILRDIRHVNRTAKTARLLNLEHGMVDERVVVKNKFEGVKVFHLLYGDIARLYDERVARADTVIVRTIDISCDGRTVAAIVRTKRERIALRLFCGRSIARIDIARHGAARDVDVIAADLARAR